MGSSERRKGQRGERELAAKLGKITGKTWVRGMQSRYGGQEQPDVYSVDVPTVHVECKIGKRPRLWAALEQARADCGANVPVVIARRDRGRWLVLCELDDLQALGEALWGR